MKRFLLCFLWVIFDIPASAQTDSTSHKDSTAPVLVRNPYATKLVPFNAHTFTSAKVPFNTNKFSLLSPQGPVYYQVYERTTLQTVMEVTGTILSLIANPRAQHYVPPQNRH